MGKFERTWQLMGASWRMLQADKRLLVFPVISAIAIGAIVVLFAVPVLVAFGGHIPDDAELHPSVQMYLGMFVFYFLAYFVAVFFNSALTACVLRQIDGERPTLGFGLAFAWQRLPQICGWALVASTVGILLQSLENKAGLVGRFVIGLVGMAWSLAAFLVVPVLVVEGTGPIASCKRSAAMLKQTWGEQIIGNVGFGLIVGMLGFAPLVLLFAVGFTVGGAAFLALLPIVVAWEILLLLVQSSLQSIYRAALYCYAATGTAPSGFDGQLLAESFQKK